MLVVHGCVQTPDVLAATRLPDASTPVSSTVVHTPGAQQPTRTSVMMMWRVCHWAKAVCTMILFNVSQPMGRLSQYVSQCCTTAIYLMTWLSLSYIVRWCGARRRWLSCLFLDLFVRYVVGFLRSVGPLISNLHILSSTVFVVNGIVKRMSRKKWLM